MDDLFERSLSLYSELLSWYDDQDVKCVCEKIALPADISDSLSKVSDEEAKKVLTFLIRRTGFCLANSSCTEVDFDSAPSPLIVFATADSNEHDHEFSPQAYLYLGQGEFIGANDKLRKLLWANPKSFRIANPTEIQYVLFTLSDYITK